MLFNRLSMRASLVITVVAMAVLGLGLAVISGRIYRDHAVDNERAALEERLRAAVERSREHLDRRSDVISRALIEQAAAPGAPNAPSPQMAARALDTLSQNVAADPDLVTIALYDQQFQLLVRRSAPGAGADAAERQSSCDAVRAQASRRSNEAPTASSSGYCVAGDRVYHSIFVPISRPFTGYLEVVTDAAAAWRPLEQSLGLPIQATFDDGAVVYESAGWPTLRASEATLIATHGAELPSRGPLIVQAAKDETSFYSKLEQTRYAVFFAAAAVTLLFVLIVLAFLEKIAIAPLRSLIEQLRGMQQDESQVGKRVDVAGNAEVSELAARFNEMTTRLEDLYENLERMAFTDPLTQLPNRSLLQDRLDHTIAAARHENKTFALFIMDLDRFKEINDTLGHNIGDLLLQQVAIRLRAKLRESDTIARMGGDEFGVLLPMETSKQADTAARMLLQSLRAPFVIETHHLDVRVSVGVALYPDHGVDAQTLIQRADVAMYAAKQAGTGHMFYDPQMDRHHPAQLTLMGELRQAVDQEQFVLYYQPKIGLKTNRVVGLEALVRWRHPSGRLIMPDTFIPLLEQTGLIRTLTGWVTHEALRMARDLRLEGFDLPIAVNISARDLHHSGLAEELAEQLAVHQAMANWLELEITESAVMSDINGTMALLTQLAGMGFRLAIDDFGTGYSSLAYLKRLPVHAVKIDKSFVMGMTKDENDAAIVYTSIDLSHNLGLEVVAEGVDDEGVLFRLRSRGCDAVQGIYLSRPLPPEELHDWLAKSSWGMPAQAVV